MVLRVALGSQTAACPVIRKVRAECLTAWARLMEVLVAGRRPARPIGAVVHLPATAIEEGRDLSSMSGVLADTAYRLLPAWQRGWSAVSSDAG
ncbi:hypothetical protein [Actinomadura formosensis]|uniref:hypothetical protein n=1 Tax=Actinomadura formosensis TaxID=60706 RepID=UPI00083799E7|nr:hypothetical protein [Actinomadura formosensis]